MVYTWRRQEAEFSCGEGHNCYHAWAELRGAVLSDKGELKLNQAAIVLHEVSTPWDMRVYPKWYQVTFMLSVANRRGNHLCF